MATYTMTLEPGTDRFCSIGYEPEKGQVYTKHFEKLALPSPLFGVTPDSATLYLYVYERGSQNSALPIKSCVAAWDGTFDHAALNALALSAALDTQAVPAAGSWMSYNVLGDATKGVREALEASRPSITFVADYGGGTPEFRIEQSYCGSFLVSPGDYALFDYPGSADGTHLPYLVITGTPSAAPVRYPRPGVAVGGMMY